MGAFGRHPAGVYQSGPCRVWIKVRNPASIAVQRERSEICSTSARQRVPTMTLRKGEITPADLKRKWPHHVALAADKVLDRKNSEIARGFADTLSLAPRQLHMCRDGTEFVIFCFSSRTTRKPLSSVSVGSGWTSAYVWGPDQ